MIQRTPIGRESALELHDQLHAIMDRLDPVLQKLADQPGIIGDGVAETRIIQQLDDAIEALWNHLQRPGRRQNFYIPSVPPGLERLDGDPSFPMDRFKRLLARFVYGAFTDDQLNEFHDSIAVSICDGEGSSSYELVCYWNNHEHGAEAVGPTRRAAQIPDEAVTADTETR